MPIRFKPDGTFEFDTIEEAVAWRDQLAKQTAAAEEKSKADTPVKAQPTRTVETDRTAGTRKHQPPPAPAVKRDMVLFLQDLGDDARKVLRTLADATPNWLGTGELAETAGVAAGKLGPIFRSIFSRGARHGYSEDELVQRTETSEKDQQYRDRPRSMYRFPETLAAEIKAAFRNLK